MNDNANRRCKFFGTLPNGKFGLVVTLEIPSHIEAVRVLTAHANLSSYKFEDDTQGDLFNA